jgi:hypothetical protein
LNECGGCGRSFNPKAFLIHQKICKKVFQTKRKAFDVAAARAPDVPDAAQFLQQAQRDKRSLPVRRERERQTQPAGEKRERERERDKRSLPVRRERERETQPAGEKRERERE